MNIYGSAMPTPIEQKIKNKVKPGCVKAKVRAVPTKGAEQGVAIRVAKKPLKKSRVLYLFCKKEIDFEFINLGVENSNTPNKFKENITRIKPIIIKKKGC